MANISQQLAALSDGERIAVKTKAKLIRDAVFNRLPELCKQPYENMVDEISSIAVYDAGDLINHAVLSNMLEMVSGHVLSNMLEMVNGQVERYDMLAMGTDDENQIVIYREHEEDYRKIATVVESMMENFDFSQPVSRSP